MSSQRVSETSYTINPETGKQIKIGGPIWKRLAATYYRIGDTFTDQTMPDSRAYVSNKILVMKLATPKRRVMRRRVSDPAGENKYIYVGSKTWNKRYLEYEWNGREFGEKRRRYLPGYLNTVVKRREMRRNKAFARFDRMVSQGRLINAIDSSLRYALTYYHTMEGDMDKEWVNEKRTRRTFASMRREIDHCGLTCLGRKMKPKKLYPSTSYSMKTMSSMAS